MTIVKNIKEKTRCSGCKCWRTKDKYIGKNGDIVKRCLKCREKDSTRSKRPDIIIKKQHLNTEWRAQNFNYRIKEIKLGAFKRGIPWKLSDQNCFDFMTSPCHYCGFNSEKAPNGIDRMIIDGIYERSNCVSACKRCNIMKGCLDPYTFTKRCSHISKHFGNIGEYSNDVWSESISGSYEIYYNNAKKRNYDFVLKENEYKILVDGKCFYCNKENTYTHRNGIDRKNSNLGYNIDNCVTCCSECNRMKLILSEKEFIEHCKKISKFCLDTGIKFDKNMKRCLQRLKTSSFKKPTKEEILEKKHILNNQEAEHFGPEIIVYTKCGNAPQYTPKQRTYKKGTNIPEDVKFNGQIPKHCYYLPATDKRSDGFCYDARHISKEKYWTTSRSRKLDTNQKFQLLINYLQENC